MRTSDSFHAVMNADPDLAHESKGQLITVVDDEADVCKALRRLLRSDGFEVDTFPSGQEFLQSIRERKPDCLILDLHLPGLTGLDVQHQLVANETGFPVILITGRDEPGLAERVLAAGAAAFLLKPVNDEELLGTVRKLLLTWNGREHRESL